MTTVADILAFLETLAPLSMKMDWDNVGLQCGSRDQQVSRILVALDPFEGVCREAVETGAQLLVTHHPLIFRPLTTVTDDRAITRGLMHLCAHGVSAACAHTNLDCAPGGVNDVLSQVLSLSGVTVIAPEGRDDQGRPWGLLRTGEIEKQPLKDFLKAVKEKLGCPGLRYVDGGKRVCRVAVGGGACASEIPTVVRAGCDTFVTADVKYNDFWEAQEQGLNLIDAGHFYTENPVCATLAAKLRGNFPGISVEISQKHTDCMKFFP